MTAEPSRPGMVDWGIGGIGLLRLLDEAVPALPVTYWSDSGTTPYGLQGTRELAARLRVVIGQLAERGCTEVVLACNAASTVVERLAPSPLPLPVPVEGIIGHGIASVDPSVRGLVGVAGGARTIHAGAYRRGLAGPGRVVRSRVAQPLSAHIETGRTGTPEFVADLAHIVGPLRGAIALVLACTHYPAALPWFADALPGTVLVDPAEHLAAALAVRHPGAAGACTSSVAERSFVTTGDAEAMRRGAALAWSIEVPDIDRVATGRPA